MQACFALACDRPSRSDAEATKPNRVAAPRQSAAYLAPRTDNGGALPRRRYVKISWHNDGR